MTRSRDTKPHHYILMKITCKHPQSQNQIPVILDDYGNPYRYQPGVAAVLARLGWSKETVAFQIGCETAESREELWRSNSPSLPLLNYLKDALEEYEPEIEGE